MPGYILWFTRIRVQDNTEISIIERQQGVFFTPEENISTIRVNPKLIQQAAAGHYMTELAFFYLLKSHFTNSRIYNINDPRQRMATLAGVSLQTANKYLSVLTFRGLVTIDKGAFVLAATPQARHKCYIRVGDRPTLQHIKNLLHAKILEQSGRQQAIKYNLEKFILTNSDREHGNCDNLIRGGTFAPRFSVRNISNILNLSVNSARNLVRDLNRAQVIRTTQADAMFLCYAGPPALSHLEGLAGYRYYSNGSLLEIQPSQHQFIQHPISIKPITGARYKRMMKDPKLRQFVYGIKKFNNQ